MPGQKKLNERVYIGLGSNVGNRPANIRSAVSLLRRRSDLTVRRLSPFYETAAVGPAQRDFVNGVAEILTRLAPRSLLSVLKHVERRLGRRKTVRWGPRVIDLDILLFGSRVLRVAGLSIPE